MLEQHPWRTRNSSPHLPNAKKPLQHESRQYEKWILKQVKLLDRRDQSKGNNSNSSGIRPGDTRNHKERKETSCDGNSSELTLTPCSVKHSYVKRAQHLTPLRR